MSKRDITIGPTTFSLGAIVGIAVGGAITLFVIVLLTLIHYGRWRERRRSRRRVSEGIQVEAEEVDFQITDKSAYPAGIDLQRTFTNSLIPMGDQIASRDWINAGPIKNPPVAKVRRFTNSKPFFQISGIRDSWPLVSSIPLTFLPSQSTMTLNQAAPPGYVVQPDSTSRWSRRSSSRHSSNRVVVPTLQPLFLQYCPEEISVIPPEPSPTPSPRKRYRRSASENQLSSILRSTSQRLKDSQNKQALTRTMTTFARLPGAPPTERLPTPPLMKQNESSEGLMDLSYAESVNSSVYESYLARTPSPKWTPSPSKRSYKSNVLTGSKGERSSSPSDDSLCEVDTPDLIIPVPLTSPSKQSSQRSSRHHRMSISSKGSDDGPIEYKHGRLPLKSTEERPFKRVSAPYSISLAGDPFYSSVRSSKPVFPKISVQGPRPLYVRKATFGQEVTTERPLSYASSTSTLRDISGNSSTSHQKNESQSSTNSIISQHNPFQWSPQESMQTQSSPKRSKSRRHKGHRRSSLVRISNLSRPQSVMSVGVVPEEAEEDLTPKKLNIQRKPSVSIVESSKSPSPMSTTRTTRRSNGRPPSTINFNPSVIIPEIVLQNQGSSAEQYSPTLSVCNYYTEEEFFKPTEKPDASNPQTHSLNRSADQILLQSDLEKFTSFPTPKMSPKLPKMRPLLTTIVSPKFNLQSAPSIAPPLLTMPIPGHLTGPRIQPPPRSPGSNPPTHDSLQSSICMLRRMNSEISHFSMISDDGDTSGFSPSVLQFATQDLNQERGRSRASHYYLSVGQTAPMIRSRAKDRRDSNHIYKERRRRRMQQEAADPDLMPVHEDSPLLGLGISTLRFPTLSSAGTTGDMPPPKSSEKEERWSDAMIKPAANAVWKESQMEHPNPQSLPKWGSGNKGLGLSLVGGKVTKIENDGENSRPNSVGLYDQEGFLKSSPVVPTFKAS